MKLRDLEARFIRREIRPCAGPGSGCGTVSPHTEHEYHCPVDTLAEADGLQFLCPKCMTDKGGRRGVHYVLCWFEGKVPDDIDPKPGRWNPKGTGIDDLSFVPGAKSCSVALIGGCAWHGFVTNGDAT
jgi:hypothetical protein